MTPSADGALLAVAGNDARIEVHEIGLEDSESLRLTLVPQNQRLLLSSCAWASPRGKDSIVTAFENSDDVWEYDLQTCREDMPSRVHRLPMSGYARGPKVEAGTSDMVAMDNKCLAIAQGSGLIKLLDIRLKRKHAFVGNIDTAMRRPLISVKGMDLYAAAAGEIGLFDRRVTSMAASTSFKSFGSDDKKQHKRSQIARKTVGPKSAFNMLQVPTSAAPGCVAYQTSDGCVGLTDMAVQSPSVFCVPENVAQPPQVNNETGLEQFGTAAEALQKPWFVRRRQGDIVSGPGPSNRGWRIVTPLVSGPGVRMVSFGAGEEARSVEFAKHHHYSCVHLAGGTTDRLVLGTATNTVKILEVDFRKGCKQQTTR